MHEKNVNVTYTVRTNGTARMPILTSCVICATGPVSAISGTNLWMAVLVTTAARTANGCGINDDVASPKKETPRAEK